MKKLDIPGSYTVALTLTDEMHHQLYGFDTSEHDAGTLGATYADLIHHYILAIDSGEPKETAVPRCCDLIWGWYMRNSDVVSTLEFTEVASEFLNTLHPFLMRALAQVHPLVIARVGVLLELDEGSPTVLLEFGERVDD